MFKVRTSYGLIYIAKLRICRFKRSSHSAIDTEKAVLSVDVELKDLERNNVMPRFSTFRCPFWELSIMVEAINPLGLERGM